MRTTISTIAALGLIVLAPAAHANASKQENIGIGTGAIIGAVAGGPVGLIVGATIGGGIGHTFQKKDDEIDALSASLEQSRDRVATLDDNIDVLRAELERSQRVARPEIVSLLEAGIAMDLLFRTDESVLADSTGIRLQELATTLASMPDIHLQLDGFADERGDESYNQDLSRQRVEFVRDQLVAAGIAPSRITVAAHGESPAQDDSIDSYALERRVSMTLYVGHEPSVVANTD